MSALFLSISLQLGLPPGLLSSLCYIESRHVAGVVHYNDGDSSSLGVCQIKYKTAKWLGFKGTSQQLMEPRINILYAGKYLKYQLTRYNWNVKRAVIAYNIGNAKMLTSTKYQRKVFNRWLTEAR